MFSLETCEKPIMKYCAYVIGTLIQIGLIRYCKLLLACVTCRLFAVSQRVVLMIVIAMYFMFVQAPIMNFTYA